MLTTLGCAAVALLLALGASGCGSEKPASTPSRSSSPDLPPGLASSPPEPPAQVAMTKESAEEFSRYFAKVLLHAARVRDATPVAALARDQATCDSCRGVADYIEGLEKDELWEDAGDLEISRLRVRSAGDTTFRVRGSAVYPRISFVDSSGKEQTKQDSSNYLFEVDLVWDADQSRWQVDDFKLVNQGKLAS